MSFKLITLIVIVLGVVALAQLVRVYELSSKLRNRREEDISNRDNRLNGNMMLLFMFIMFGGFIWLMMKYGWTGRGVAASVHGETTDWLLNLNLIIIIIVFFFTNSLLFYFTFKYVRKPGVKAYFFPHDNKLELLWTVVPAIVLAVIIILGLKTWNDVTADSKKEAIKIELFSKQFDWTARYAGTNNILGGFDYKLTTQENELGLMTSESLDSAIMLMQVGKADGSIMGIKQLEEKLNNPKNIFIPEDREKMVNDLDRKTRLVRMLIQMKARYNKKKDAHAYDDIIQKDTLHLCVNKDYELTFRAKDVIHSAYFPHFRAQMNTVPGLTTRLKMNPKYTTAQMREKNNNPKFNYVLMCNKICGSAHYKMKMIVVVDTPAQYKAWLKSKEKQTFKDVFLAAPAPAAEVPAEGAAPADTLKMASK
ncbi:MAG: cytochrome c oxidase subunit II transmembrane domain-containing protein [Flavobacteriia bacterium]|jgi:cytochrome c oxidase subunit 2